MAANCTILGVSSKVSNMKSIPRPFVGSNKPRTMSMLTNLVAGSVVLGLSSLFTLDLPPAWLTYVCIGLIAIMAVYPRHSEQILARFLYLGPLQLFNSKEPPLVLGTVPFVTQTVKLMANYKSMLSDNFNACGDTFSTSIGGNTVTFVNDDSDAEQFAKSKHFSFNRGMIKVVGPLSPNGILLDKTYQLNSTAFKSALSRSNLEKFIPIISSFADMYVAGIKARARPDGSTTIENIFSEMDETFIALTCRVFGGKELFSVKADPDDCEHPEVDTTLPRTKFGENFKSANPERIVHGGICVKKAFKALAKNPLDPNSKNNIDASVHRMAKMLQKVCKQYKEDGGMDGELNFPRMLLKHPKMCDAAINDEHAVTMAGVMWGIMMGTQFNSYTGLTWLLIHSTREPWFLEEAHAERKKVGGSKDMRDYTMDDLAQMKVMEMAILETVRLYQNGCLFREIQEDTKICGGKYTIPRGRVVGFGVGNHFLHRWENSEKWDPKRMETERLKKDIPHLGGFMFGHGRYPCIGKHFAIMQLRLLFHKLTEAFDIECLDEDISPNFPLNSMSQSRYPVALKFTPKK